MMEENMDKDGLSVVVTQPKNSAGPKATDDDNPATDSPDLQDFSIFDPFHLLPLQNTDRIYMKRRTDTNEGVKLGSLGCDTQMRYELINRQNQTIFTVEESSDFCERSWFCGMRSIWAHVKDGDGNTVIYFDRPLNCQLACFPCSLQVLTVESPQGNMIGHIEQKWGLQPILHIKNKENTVLYIIKGIYCHCSCKCEDIDFPILLPDAKTICGKISNRWNEIIHEEVYADDNFGVIFPPEVDLNTKVLLMGAAFLTNYMYFQSPIQ